MKQLKSKSQDVVVLISAEQVGLVLDSKYMDYIQYYVIVNLKFKILNKHS